MHDHGILTFENVVADVMISTRAHRPGFIGFALSRHRPSRILTIVTADGDMSHIIRTSGVGTMTAPETSRATDTSRATQANAATTSASPRSPTGVDLTGDRIVCRECPSSVEDEVRRLWMADRARLVRRVKGVPDEEPHFNVVLSRTPGGYEVRLTLPLASATLAARGEHDTLAGALGQATTRLENKLAQHLSVHRHHDLRRRLRQRRGDLEDADAGLAADRARGDQNAFAESLRPFLPRLRELARHEIVVAQLEGRILPGAVTVGDLLDGVLARAWDRYESHPADVSLDSWLVRLLHEIADEKLGTRPGAAASRPVDATSDHYRVDDGEGWARELEPHWLDQHGITRADLLPDGSDEEQAQEGMDVEALQRQVLDALRGAPEAQRRAFLLAAFEGWTEEEIGMLLRRAPEQVRADLAAARERVRERLAARATPH
jgi:RNA polymerase sigma factor (sigma-70 family)